MCRHTYATLSSQRTRGQVAGAQTPFPLCIPDFLTVGMQLLGLFGPLNNSRSMIRAHASSQGIEITHRARQITRDDLRRFDHVIVMDASYKKNVLALTKSDAERAKVRLLREFEPGAEPEAEVPDPYYSGQYAHVFEICERASRGLLAHVRARHGL